MASEWEAAMAGAAGPIAKALDDLGKARDMIVFSRAYDDIRAVDAAVTELVAEWRAADGDADKARSIRNRVSKLEDKLDDLAGLPDGRSLIDVAVWAKGAGGFDLVRAGHCAVVQQRIFVLRVAGGLPPPETPWPVRRRRLSTMRGAGLRLLIGLRSIVWRNAKGEREMQEMRDAALDFNATQGDAVFDDGEAGYMQEAWAEAEALHDAHRDARRSAEAWIDLVDPLVARLDVMIALGDAEAGRPGAIDLDELKKLDDKIEDLMRDRALKRRGG